MRNISDKIIEKIKTHILCSVTSFFSFDNSAVCDIGLMWKNNVQPDKLQTSI